MILYVESNFPLELARRQEELGEAEEILRLAQAAHVQLHFPAIALTEPFSTLDRYANERARFLQTLNTQLSDLSRSQPHQPLVANLNPLVSTLTSLRKDETDRLEAAVERMLNSGRPIALTAEIYAQARHFANQYDLCAPIESGRTPAPEFHTRYARDRPCPADHREGASHTSPRHEIRKRSRHENVLPSLKIITGRGCPVSSLARKDRFHH
jgi:hypothetical protein